MRQRVVSALLAAAIVVVPSPAPGGRWSPRPMDEASFQRLLEVVRAESLDEDKVERLRARWPSVGGGTLMTSSQAIRLLNEFSFWVNRLEALRRIRLENRQAAAAVLDYFLAAPSLIRSEVQRMLGV